ncbi:MAG: damage-control phosphatase ARMT1 family protein [Bacteroidota bacterium]
MKTYLDCFPCFIEQALRAGRLVTDDERLIKELVDSVGESFKNISLESSPPEMGEFIYGKIREMTGIDDPYREIKKSNINEALAIYPDVKKMLDKAEDRLLVAIRLAIAGNIIDFAFGEKFDLKHDIERILEQEFAIFHYNEFKEHLDNVSSILYIGDNAGESVFDRLLIEELGKPVTYVVRGKPIINDVTMEDAVDSGLDRVAELISSGSTAPGAVLRLCNDEFLKRFEKAEMIISKGQGNYEALSDVKKTIFFLLKAKCKMISKDLGVNQNDIVFYSINA